MLSALETLKAEGFGGTSARAIARHGDFNQALIFYHFGTITEVLLAALDRISEERLARYRCALAEVSSLTELAGHMAELYAEDMRDQNIAAIQELVAGSSSNPALGQEIIARLEPWMGLATELAQRFLKGTVFENLIPTRQLAYAAIGLYMGMETLTHLDGDRAQAAELFDTAKTLAPMLDMLLRPGGAEG